MEPKRYGPYKGERGHLFYTDEYPNNIRKTVWAHREIMENHLGKKLLEGEVVHHKNEDPGDNRIENLEVKTKSQHARDHRPPPEMIGITCPECKIRIKVLARQVRHNQSTQKKEGPFCGRSCAGKWNARKQYSRSGDVIW